MITEIHDQNQRLTEEQEQYTKLLLKQSREFEKKNSEAEKVGKGKVMEALQDKWVACKEEEQRLEGECGRIILLWLVRKLNVVRKSLS